MFVRAFLLLLGLLAGVGFAPLARAHSPFDCSVRIIVHADSAEVRLVAGQGLGENLLRPADVPPGRLVVGQPLPLASRFATNLFAVSADGMLLVPRVANVITDGVEYSFSFEYVLGPAKSLGVESYFLPSLKPPHAAPLVLTDENANLLASAILTLEKPGTEFALSSPSPALVASDKLKVESSELVTSNQQPATPRPAPSFADFLQLGIGHILNLDAFDHLLFLAALLLGCRKVRTMLLVVTGFTVAHSITLALAALDVVTLAPRIVEPLIALSIIFVAADNFRRSETSWQRYALTGGFGLIHGFAFAGILRESGLAGTGWAMVKPLLAFNLGVEIAQVMVVLILLPALLLLNRWESFQKIGIKIVSGIIMLLATFWLWQRLG